VQVGYAAISTLGLAQSGIKINFINKKKNLNNPCIGTLTEELLDAALSNYVYSITFIYFNEYLFNN
jgi:hypothetical protein